MLRQNFSLTEARPLIALHQLLVLHAAAAQDDVAPQARAAEVEEACCPNGGHRRAQSGSCSLPNVCPSASCADTFVPFFEQCEAQLRYAGKLSKLYPEDPIAAAQVDAMMAATEDMTIGISCSSYPQRFGVSALIEDGKEEDAKASEANSDEMSGTMSTPRGERAFTGMRVD